MNDRRMSGENLDPAVVEGFGDEWDRFDQTRLGEAELRTLWDLYFRIFPWEQLPPEAVGMDAGCGSGRWAQLVAPRVGWLHCVDAAEKALAVAKRNLSAHPNVEFHLASIDAIPLADESLDFAYSLGVLHHMPDTAAAIRSCVSKLKPGAPFLIYLYYAFDNRPAWFRGLWRLSELIRKTASRTPHGVRYGLSQVLAVTLYWPLSRTARMLEKCGRDVGSFPLSFYRDRSFYVMRTDALDRFGTRLERRFTKAEITEMMTAAGLADIRFSDSAPYWCAVGIKRQTEDVRAGSRRAEA